ncbi:molybdenum cofactor guanylyltransferase [Bordetella genomosp. 8]|uniref:Molybdenum cofactor guanylyltransferase n=1 Tax=Bordetella genomosp. 8 TaxID=1416806 RepID=A0A1W6YRD4_9BORD|nr:molybdenum cofactor guanylyltransferase MobA [Bordetella genomosp. 8]ARP83558.1 molybdenum cofactor guanylyltransferase [Bordetella genomosp. 8]
MNAQKDQDDQAGLAAPTGTDTIEAAHIAGLILAGGRGSRMGDMDKGCALLRGRPMVEHVAARFAPQVGALLISANRNLDRYAEYGKVVADDPAHGQWQGPLAGVAAGLVASRCPWLATAPCDVPFLPVDMVARLRQALQARGTGVQGNSRGIPRLAVACSAGQRQPVCMLVSRELLPDLLQYLAQGGRKVETWQSRVGCVEVPFDDQPGAFLNVNTERDLSAADRAPS